MMPSTGLEDPLQFMLTLCILCTYALFTKLLLRDDYTTESTVDNVSLGILDGDHKHGGLDSESAK